MKRMRRQGLLFVGSIFVCFCGRRFVFTAGRRSCGQEIALTIGKKLLPSDSILQCGLWNLTRMRPTIREILGKQKSINISFSLFKIYASNVFMIYGSHRYWDSRDGKAEKCVSLCSQANRRDPIVFRSPPFFSFVLFSFSSYCFWRWDVLYQWRNLPELDVIVDTEKSWTHRGYTCMNKTVWHEGGRWE